MAALTAFGLSANLPPGWDGEIYAAADAAEVAAAAAPRAVLHAATFPLPPGRGDFGTGAAEVMRPGDVLVILFEYQRASATQPLFAEEGVPVLAPADFSDRTMPRRLPGLVGAQRFFTLARRAFCLHALIGAGDADPELVAVVNAVAAGIRIA